MLSKLIFPVVYCRDQRSQLLVGVLSYAAVFIMGRNHYKWYYNILAAVLLQAVAVFAAHWLSAHSDYILPMGAPPRPSEGSSTSSLMFGGEAAKAPNGNTLILFSPDSMK